jgi:predicted dehydrogenase
VTPFRVAVVGAGAISPAWLPLLRDRADVDVVAVADPDEAAAHAALARDGLEAPVFGTFEAAAAATAPDVVVNLTPPAAHRHVVEAALGLGCHVLGEKPIATTLADAHALVDAARRADRTYAVMQNRRFERGVRTLRDAIAADRIGRPTIVSCDLFVAPHFGGFREQMTSPLLLDMAIHQFDQARFLIGAEPVAVTCRELNPAGSWYAHGAAAVALFEFDDGTVFSFRGSWTAAGFATSWNGAWRITATRGSALWDGDGDPVAEVPVDPPEPMLLHPTRPVALEPSRLELTDHAACLDDMLAAIANGRCAETDCADNVKSFAMVVAAIESARTGTRVQLAT